MNPRQIDWHSIVRRVSEDSSIILTGLVCLSSWLRPHLIDGAIVSTSVASNVSSALFLLLFIAGLVVRMSRYLTGRVSLLNGGERDRGGGRNQAEDVPAPRRHRRKHDDDPALPFGR